MYAKKGTIIMPDMGTVVIWFCLVNVGMVLTILIPRI